MLNKHNSSYEIPAIQVWTAGKLSVFLIRYLDISKVLWYLNIKEQEANILKEYHHHHKHHDSDNTLGSLLDRCGHYFVHRIGSKKKGQESILSVISKHPCITQKELGEILGIQPASVSELLMKLEKKGLVLREKDDRDRRSIKVQLTEDGRNHLAEPEEKSADPFQSLSVEEQEQLYSLLEKLLTDWDQRFPAERHRHKHHKHHHEKENLNGKYD